MKINLFLILLSYLPITTFANDDCEPLRLDSPGGSMEQVQPRSEGGIDICFGDSAAAITDAWRFSHGDTNYSHQTSGLIAAIQIHQHNKDFSPDAGGEIPDTINELNVNGSCNEAVVLEELGPQVTDNFVRKLEAFQYAKWHDSQLRNGQALYQTYVQNNINPWLVSLLKTYGNEPQGVNSLENYININNLGQNLANSDPANELFEILGSNCAGDNLIPLQMPHFSNVDTTSNSVPQTFDAINSQLTSIQSLPVGISFCGGVIVSGKGFKGLHKSNGNVVFDKYCYEHASLVIGRRRDPSSGNCQLLVRDDYGKDCLDNQENNKWACGA